VAAKLGKRLADEIAGDEARRKTITVLTRIWVKVPEQHRHLRDEALQLAAHVTPEERLWLHWGMSLLSYPFFRDVAATVGQLGWLQGTLSQSQIQRRMAEAWGERSTVKRVVARILRTFIDWRVLLDTDARGSYQIAARRCTENRQLGLWLLSCALCAADAEQVPLNDLARLSYLFPFELLRFAAIVRRSDRFEVNREGLDLETVALSPTSSRRDDDLCGNR
jgi:hypothetical protein